MKVLAIIFITMVALIGCNLMEVHVEVAQRAILDKGDSTKDTFAKNGDSKAVKQIDKTTSVIGETNELYR